MISNFERISYFLICITLLTIYNEGCIIAQQRPKVGVVLSGGGARGLAHIGVLKVLEEAGIQPDYITGTSMGGIIAGLYASGYSAADLSKLNASLNWEYILSKNVPLNQIDMDEKEMYGKSILTFPIIDGRPNLPPGFLEGQKLSELISGLTWNTAGINNFDSLKIPFQCPVTNLVTSEVLILDTGNLASAMRATMSIPMIFTPYRMDSTTLLVDGGIMRNFPVQDVIDMGADIVIGAYVGYYTKKTANDYKSIQSILTRTANIAGASDVIKQLDLPDILITPDLNGFSGTNFSKNKEIEKKGEEAAQKKIELLKSLADSINKLGPPKAKKVLPLNDSLFIQKIKIENCISTSPEFIISRSSLTENTWITRTEINKAIGKVFGSLYYDNITYRFEKAGDNFNLIISVLEKSRSYFNMAVHYDNYYGGGIMLGYTKRDLIFGHSRFNTVADITPYPQFNIDYDKYFGLKQKTIVSFQFTSGRNKIPAILVEQPLETINEYRFEIGLKASQSFGINQLAGIGISEDYSSIYPTPEIRESTPEWNFTNYDVQNLKLKGIYQINHLDNMIYPTSGLYMNFDITANLISHHFFSDLIDTVDYQMLELQSNSYQKISLAIDYYLPVSQHIIISSGIYVGLSNKEIPITDKFYAGGCRYNLRKRQIPFSGLNPNEIATNNLITMNFGVKFKIKSAFYIHGITNWLSRGESIQELSDQIRLHNNNNILGFGTGLTYKSFLGPICFLAGWNTMDNKPRYYLNLGFNF